jgi:FGGY-family pentulose kinase
MAGGRVFIGVDVGTASARAGVFDASGRMLAHASQTIQLWYPEPEFAEQSSEDIWKACCAVVRKALADAKLKPEQVAGVGFDATCSLVVLDAQDKPVTVSPSGNDAQNIIVWMDHRAIPQAERINAFGHDVLRYVGGRISPEMQSPKLLWLKEKLPQTWKRAAHFLDLPDFLTYRATGDLTRSLCTTTCKWTYLAHEAERAKDGKAGWQASFFKQIGLEEFPAEDYKRIGQKVRPMGEAIGRGLTEAAAKELGLAPGTAVGVGIIDAHAGGLGVIGAEVGGRAPSRETMRQRLALIGGTSSCHMAVSPEAVFVPGVWGPYYSAMVPGLWLTEGGQSATGALIDHVIFSHAGAVELQAEARKTGKTVYELLNADVERLAGGLDVPARLTAELHVLPYFHGNRSPRANPTLRGMVSGLRLSATRDDVALLYLATIQAIAHGTRHIIDEMNQAGFAIDLILACGGGTKNPVFLREHADITGCLIALPAEPEAVLLGSAILGAVASGAFASVLDAMRAMNKAERIIEPSRGAVADYHSRKHKIFHRMHEDQVAYRGMVD